MPGWLTATEVAAHADVVGTPTAPGASLANATAAAEAYVESARRDLTFPTVPAEVETKPVPATVKVGALMLAWRWYERRNTPLGMIVAPTGDPIEMLRDDPDIAKLLGVGRSGRFVFGSAPPPPAVVLDVQP